MSLAALLKPRLTELGKIKIGKKEDKVRQVTGSDRTWRAPQKIDHFLITTLHRTAKGDLINDQALMDSLSRYADSDGKLRQIPITLLSDEPEDCMQSAYVWYNSRSVAARGDGETVTWFVDKKTGAAIPEPITEPWKPDFADMLSKSGKKLFKLHTNFSCVIASGDARWGGVYKLRTTSRITADQLYGSLLHLKALTSGILRGLPLMLVVRPMEVTPEGKATTVYVVHVELRGADLQAVQRLALEQMRYKVENAREVQQAQIEFRKLLQAPGEGETAEEIDEVEQEFHPIGEPSTVVTPAPVEDDPLAAQMGLDGGAAAESSEPSPVEIVDESTGEVIEERGDCGCPDGPAGQHELGCAMGA